MDDMSDELRSVVETVRAARLTASDKARMWRRLQEAIEQEASAEERRAVSRWGGVRFSVPRLALAAAAVGCLLGAVLDADRLTSPSSPSASVSAAGAARSSLASRAARSLDELATPTPTPKEVVREARVARAKAAVPRRAESRRTAPASAEPAEESVAAAPVAVAQWEPEASWVAPRVEPARTRELAASRGSSSAAASVPASVALAKLQARLRAEDRERYRAALAQQARAVAVSRPLATVGGYAAW